MARHRAINEFERRWILELLKVYRVRIVARMVGRSVAMVYRIAGRVK